MRFARLIGAVGVSALAAACSSGDNLAPPSGQPQEGTRLGVSPSGEVQSTFKVIKGSGDITVTITQFRDALGQPANGGKAGQQSTGRREINWDGVPATFDNNNNFPGDFFNTKVKAGAVITSEGTGLRNSSNDFADLNPAYAAQFEPFSKPKMFASIGSPLMDLTFRVAGSDTPAAVTGVGIVFSDVDRDGSASIKLFDAKGRNLGRYFAPVRSDATGLSFVGVVFDAAIVAQVTIAAGEAPIDAGLQDLSDGGLRDLVVTDNFLFGEPQALP
jgi:hypothetical protein